MSQSTKCLSSSKLFVLVVLQLSPKANLTASPSARARSATATARSPNESPRIATAKSLLTGKTGKKTETKTGTKTEIKKDKKTVTKTEIKTDEKTKTEIKTDRKTEIKTDKKTETKTDKTTETKKETEIRTEGAAMQSPFPPDATVKTARIAVQRRHRAAGTAGTRAAAVWSPSL